MGTTEDGDRAALPVQVTERVGELGRLGERADEHQIEIARQHLRDALAAGVAGVVHLVPGLLAPDRQHLGHDAGEVGVHEPPVEGVAGILGGEIEDADAAAKGPAAVG